MTNKHKLRATMAAPALLPPFHTTVAAPAGLPAAASRPRTGRRRRPVALPVDPMTYELTVSLVAARLEDDDAIHLVIAGPDDLSVTMLVEFPAAGQDDGRVDQALRERMQAARASFVSTFVQPSFEGFVLLYGAARLTVVRPAAEEDDGAAPLSRRQLPRVLDFAALDAAAPLEVYAARRRLRPNPVYAARLAS